MTRSSDAQGSGGSTVHQVGNNQVLSYFTGGNFEKHLSWNFFWKVGKWIFSVTLRFRVLKEHVQNMEGGRRREWMIKTRPNLEELDQEQELEIVQGLKWSEAWGKAKDSLDCLEPE